MTTDPYLRWAEESRRQWRREIFFENLASIPRKALAFFVSAIVLGLFLGIAFSVAHIVQTFAYDYDTAMQKAAFSRVCKERLQAGLEVSDACRPLVDGKRGDLER